MKKTDKSLAKKDSKSQARFSRSDKLALIKEIHHMMSNFDYVSVNIFKESIQNMVNRIRALEPLGKSPVMVPGDPEKKSIVDRAKHGIPIDTIKYKEYLGISDLFSSCLING